MRLSTDNRNYQKGSLLLEVVVVVAVIVLSVIAALSVAQKSIALSRQSVQQAQVSFLLEEGAEVVRILRDNDWLNISSLNLDTEYYPLFSGGVWSLSSTPNQVGIFTRTIFVSSAYRDSNQDLAMSGSIDSDARLVTVTVSWTEGGEVITKTLQFYIFNVFS